MSADDLAAVYWYWRDWRASRARAVMSPLARGVYRELLDAHYLSDNCSIPNDDDELAALAGVSPAEWDEVRAEVLRWMPVITSGRLRGVRRRNRRAYEEWVRSRKLRADKRKAARARWDKRADRADAAHMRCTCAAHAPQCSPSPSPYPTDKGSPKAKKSRGQGLTGDDVAARLRFLERNRKAQKPGRDGSARTLYSADSYLLQLRGLIPDDEFVRLKTAGWAGPGALLEDAAPDRFAALVGRVRRNIARVKDPEAYMRTALAGAWARWIAERRPS